MAQSRKTRRSAVQVLCATRANSEAERAGEDVVHSMAMGERYSCKILLQVQVLVGLREVGYEPSALIM